MAAQSYQSLSAEIRKGTLHSIYLLHGEEGFFIDSLMDQISANALSEAEKAFNEIIFYGRDADAKEVIDASRQYPMMAGKRVVILKEAQMMRSLKDLEHYLLRPTETTILVICHKHKKVDGRSSFYKAAQKNAVVFESKLLTDTQIPSWIASFARARGYSFDPEAAVILTEYLGNDLMKMSGELDKLFLSIPKGSKIEKEQVFDNIGISREYNVFEFQKALGQKDLPRIQKILKHFIANTRTNPLVMLISILYGYFSKIYIVKSMGRATDQALAESIGMRSTWFIKEYKEAAANYTTSELESILGVLRDFDLKSKGRNADQSISPEPQLMLEMVQQILAVRYVHSA